MARSRAACSSPRSSKTAARLFAERQGVGVVFAQYPAAAVQGVLI